MRIFFENISGAFLCFFVFSGNLICLVYILLCSPVDLVLMTGSDFLTESNFLRILGDDSASACLC